MKANEKQPRKVNANRQEFIDFATLMRPYAHPVTLIYGSPESPYITADDAIPKNRKEEKNEET